MGELRQTPEKISLYGKNLGTLPTAERIRRGVSRTDQSPRPFLELSVLENIRVGLMHNSIWSMITNGPDKYREIQLALDVGFSENDF